jgi:hypothetical protein
MMGQRDGQSVEAEKSGQGMALATHTKSVERPLSQTLRLETASERGKPSDSRKNVRRGESRIDDFEVGWCPDTTPFQRYSRIEHVCGCPKLFLCDFSLTENKTSGSMYVESN